jgi:16S rRNA processing protein RimM
MEPESHPKQESPDLITVGRVIKPFGLKGQVVIAPLTDFPERFAPGGAILIEGRSFEISASQLHKGRWLLKLKGVDTPEQAEDLRGCALHVPESDLHPLPEGEYYRFQMIGLLAVNKDGDEVGRVTDVLETGGNDVYLIKGPGGERLVPALPQFVTEIDLDAGRMIVEDAELV